MTGTPAELIDTDPLARPRAEASAGTHLPVLDGLRGVAILLVLFHHFTIRAGVQPRLLADRLYFRLAEATWCGVDLFFVLSGFLITGILLRTRDRPGYFRNFYMRRCLRIFPLYYVTLIVVFWVAPLLVTPGATYAALLQDQAWFWSYLPNVLFASTGWPDFNGIGHLWSLGVEEQFYLVWPLLILLTSRRSLIAICLTMLVVSLLIRVGLAVEGHRVAAYVLMPARMDAFAVGALLATVGTDAQGLARIRRYAPPLALLAFATLAGIGYRYRGLNAEAFYVVTVATTCFAVLFGVLISVALQASTTSRTHRVLTHRALVFFGRYSYGIYMIHSLLLYRLVDHVFSGASIPALGGSVLPGVLVFTVFGSGLSVLLALASWHAVEQPFLRLKRFYSFSR